MIMKAENAIVLTNGLLHLDFAKTCHGLLRGSERFTVIAVIDPVHAGSDAGMVMEGRENGVPVLASVDEYLGSALPSCRQCVVGVAFPGGKLPESIRGEIRSAIINRMHITCGLHTMLADDPEFSLLARQAEVRLHDIRRPRPTSELSFWSGAIYQVQTPVVAVLGMDCAVGKRTTCRFLRDACLSEGIQAEMIYTGQTGWMQGYRHGFIFDATLNDFISGEIERVILECERDSRPDLILVEGQSALRNPAGPCGSEFILSGNVKGVILQHIPGRECYEDTTVPIKSIETEIELIRLYGAEVLAVTLNSLHIRGEAMREYRLDLEKRLGMPVSAPLEDGVGGLLPILRQFMATHAAPATSIPRKN